MNRKMNVIWEHLRFVAIFSFTSVIVVAYTLFYYLTKWIHKKIPPSTGWRIRKKLNHPSFYLPTPISKFLKDGCFFMNVVNPAYLKEIGYEDFGDTPPDSSYPTESDLPGTDEIITQSAVNNFDSNPITFEQPGDDPGF